MPVASLIKDRVGWRILFSTGARGPRKCVRLGATSEKNARFVHLQIERLLAARHAGSIDPSTAEWVAGLEDRLHDRLARAGLVEPRERAKPTVGRLMTAYFDILDVKPSTRTTYEQTRRAFEDHFGINRPLAEITPLDAARWKQAMLDQGLAPPTVAKRIKTARQVLRQGIRWKMLGDNPLADVKGGSERNPDRLVFIPRDHVERVLAATADVQWRCLIALSRYGGLRIPSEALALRWEHINWDADRITIPSPKTAGQGRASRVIPLFPELRPHLLAAFERAATGDEFVISAYRDAASNLRTQFQRLLARAGVPAWPRLWHNMRASRATELAAEFPSHIAAAWCGHTETIADHHYRMVRDEDFARATGGGSNSGAQAAPNAAQIAAQHRNAPVRTEAQPSAQAFENSAFVRVGSPACASVREPPMTPTGFEPVLPP